MRRQKGEAPMKDKITADAVRWAYRLILGREPESEEAVDIHLRKYKSVTDLRRDFFKSPEFAAACDGVIEHVINTQFWATRSDVETKTTPENMALILERIKGQWAKLGEEDPYWSVLSADHYRKPEMSESRIKEFYETGASTLEVLRRFEEKTETKVKRGVCFELGCGVGRISVHLAKEFEGVIAADISPGNLRLCEQRAKTLGLTNLETMLIKTPDDLQGLPEIDLFLSFIVLQHNPPPIQRLFLETILPKIRNGGGCFFQTPAFLGENHFSVDDYLNSAPEPIFDGHPLPKPVVLRLIHDSGLAIRDIALDNCLGGGLKSYTYFATRD
jgi:2-polyprenyl-3-methyl-5-hydroxy-6-metoxy-1,4-benzoquinol methylase